MPLFKKKSDSKIAAAYSTDAGSSGYAGYDSAKISTYSTYGGGADVQAALAVTNNIAVQANYSYRNEHTNYRNVQTIITTNEIYLASRTEYKRNLFEISAGYFTAFNKRKTLIFQLNAGFGFGRTRIWEHGTDSAFNPYNRFFNSNVFKINISPSFSFYPKEAFSVSFVTRASVTKFGKANTDYLKSEQRKLNLDSLDRAAVLFFEPAWIFSMGLNRLPGLRLEFQFGASVLLHSHRRFISYRSFNAAAGLVCDVRKLFKKKQG